MDKVVITVEGMSCEHCVKAVTSAVSSMEGAGGVHVDLAGKTVTVEHDPAKCPLDKIKAVIEDQGFDVIMATQ